MEHGEGSWENKNFKFQQTLPIEVSLPPIFPVLGVNIIFVTSPTRESFASSNSDVATDEAPKPPVKGRKYYHQRDAKRPGLAPKTRSIIVKAKRSHSYREKRKDKYLKDMEEKHRLEEEENKLEVEIASLHNENQRLLAILAVKTGKTKEEVIRLRLSDHIRDAI